jgi:hypothetical protein
VAPGPLPPVGGELVRLCENERGHRKVGPETHDFGRSAAHGRVFAHLRIGGVEETATLIPAAYKSCSKANLHMRAGKLCWS